MGGLENIFKKLNIMERNQLNNYIDQQASIKMMKNTKELEELASKKEKYLEELNNNTWQRIETFIHIAMREHKISEERIKKIDARVLELSNENEGEKLLIGEERKTEYKIMQSDDFAKMVELLMDSNCKNCHEKHSKCEVYELLKKYNIPYSPFKGKCKYSYLKIGKKVI
jgi:uncharacterized protein YPO0396